MKITKRLWIAVLLSVMFLFNCSPSKSVTSIVDTTFEKEIKKIFIIVNTSRATELFWTGFKDVLKDKFIPFGIETMIYDMNILSLDGHNEINGKIDEYNPDIIMNMVQYLDNPSLIKFAGEGAIIQAGGFQIDLKEPNSNKLIWKASISHGLNTWDHGHKAARLIVSQMEEDGLIFRLPGDIK